MASLTKAELVASLVAQIGITHDEAAKLVCLCFEEISYALEKGDTVFLQQFGRFKLRRKNARPGRNPKTGEAKLVSERTVVTFKPSNKLLLKINH